MSKISILDDKNQLSWQEYGAADGKAVFYFHGMPGSHLEAKLADTIAHKLGIRLIAPNRPGYAQSIAEKQGLMDWPDLISQLADELLLSQFSILGFSGGGPYALACAHKLPHRTRKISLVSSLAPFESQAMQKFVNPGSRPLYDLAASDPQALRQQLTAMVSSPQALMAIMQATLPAQDKLVFEDDNFYDQYLDNLTLAISSGIGGLTNDLCNVSTPWGFDLQNIQMPVDIWHGVHDSNIGMPVAEYLAQEISRSQLHRLNDSGHFFIDSLWKEILENLTS